MKHDRKQYEAWARETGSNLRGMTVKLRGRDGMNHALRTLKKAMVEEGVVKEMRRKEYHETKGQIRRRKQAQQRRRHLKMIAEQKQNDFLGVVDDQNEDRY